MLSVLVIAALITACQAYVHSTDTLPFKDLFGKVLAASVSIEGKGVLDLPVPSKGPDADSKTINPWANVLNVTLSGGTLTISGFILINLKDWWKKFKEFTKLVIYGCKNPTDKESSLSLPDNKGNLWFARLLYITCFSVPVNLIHCLIFKIITIF